MRWRWRRRPAAVWFRCDDPGRVNDARMRWHYYSCGRCEGAARALGRTDVLETMRLARLGVTPPAHDDDRQSRPFPRAIP